MITTREIVQSTAGQLLLGSPDTSFPNISIDTRTLRPGDLFAAIPGVRYDSHDFLAEALNRGAAGLLVQSLDSRLPSLSEHVPDILKVPDTLTALQDIAAGMAKKSNAVFVAITGSNGKTTTKEMLASIFERSGPTLMTYGNLNNHIGVPLTIFRLTPSHKYAVIEMGTSMPGDIAQLVRIVHPSISIITNIGRAHLERLQSPEGILAEKRLVFNALSKDGTAIVNADDILLAPLIKELPCRVITFGISEKSFVTARETEATEQGSKFVLHIGNTSSPVEIKVHGRFQVLNALAAAAAAHAAGVPLDLIVEGLQNFRSALMRMQVLAHPSGATLVNDAYNANPSSMRASIEGFLAAYPAKPHWVVIGDMRELGEHNRKEHKDLGEWLHERNLDRVFLYGRDTRFVLREGLPVKRFKKKKELAQGLKEALGAASVKPVVLFKASRRMKLEEVVASLMKTV